jgi:hypothetical protein
MLAQSPRLRRLALCACAALLSACGGADDDDKADSAAADGGAGDAGAGDGAGADAAKTDASGADAAKTDTSGADTSAADTAKADTAGPAPTCGDALTCAASCQSDDAACLKACRGGLAAAETGKLDAIDACRVDLCGAVTEGAVAEVNCAFAKCYDALDACVGFGAGEADCADTARCIGACVHGDAICKLACLRAADQGAVASAKALRVCGDGQCDLKAPAAERAACLAAQCGGELAACVDAGPQTCRWSNYCAAHCPESTSVKPNACVSTCLALAGDAARGQHIALDACRVQCVQETNPTACVASKCGGELSACYGVGSTKSCQDLDTCASEQCEGVGAPFTCLEGCVKDGKPGSQDAFLHFEGCLVKNMDSKEAKLAGCSFPYDLATCLPIIKGHFCSNQTQNCLIDK